MYGKRVKARVLECDHHKAVLGVYYKGMFRRVHAYTAVPLRGGDWIEGILELDEDSSTILFKLLSFANDKENGILA